MSLSEAELIAALEEAGPVQPQSARDLVNAWAHHFHLAKGDQRSVFLDQLYAHFCAWAYEADHTPPERPPFVTAIKGRFESGTSPGDLSASNTFIYLSKAAPPELLCRELPTAPSPTRFQPKLTDDQRFDIIRARKAGVAQREIARRFGVSRSAVRAVLNHWAARRLNLPEENPNDQA